MAKRRGVPGCDVMCESTYRAKFDNKQVADALAAALRAKGYNGAHGVALEWDYVTTDDDGGDIDIHGATLVWRETRPVAPTE